MAGIAVVALAACGQTPKVAAKGAAPDPVAARVDDAPIYRSDVLRIARLDGRDAGDPAVFAASVDEAVDQKLLANGAVKDGLDTSEDGRRRLSAARDRVLSDMALEAALKGAVTPEAVSGLYAEMEKARPPGAPPETLDQARPRIVRFLTYDRVKDLVLDLRHRARIELVAQPSRPGASKP